MSAIGAVRLVLIYLISHLVVFSLEIRVHACLFKLATFLRNVKYILVNIYSVRRPRAVNFPNPITAGQIF